MNGGMSLPCVLVKMARKRVANQPERTREDETFGGGMIKLKKQSNQRRTE